MIGRRTSGGTPSGKDAATRFHVPARVSLLALLLTAIGLSVLEVPSASGERLVFPGRSGKLVLLQRCANYAGGGEGTSCGTHFATVGADGSSFRLLSPTTVFFPVGARVSPDGLSVLVSRGGLGELPTAIGAKKLVGGRVKEIYSLRRSLRTELSVQIGDWLPDGKRIVFLGNKGSRTGIYTIAVDGTRQRTVRVFADRSLNQGGPTFYNLRASPDGRRFAFIRSRGLYVMNANGSGMRRIVTGCFPTLHDWSPNSKRLLVSWYDEDEDPKTPPCGNQAVSGLYTLSANGGAPNRVFTDRYVRPPRGDSYGGVIGHGTFSPDGTSIAFGVKRLPLSAPQPNQVNTIMAMRANGTGVRTVRQGEAIRNQDGDCTRCVGYEALSWLRVPR